MKNIIKYLRDSKNYSQAQVAEVLDVSRQAYIKYESGEVEPPVSVVRALSRLYSVSCQDLIDDKIPEHKEVTYQIREKTLQVAQPANSISDGFTSSCAAANSTSSLVSQLAYIKMLLAGFEVQLKKETASSSVKTAGKTAAAIKPRLNISGFLASTKPVQIDGSFVDQLRSESQEREF